MTALASDHQPVDPPRPAEHGVRWSDVPMAVYYAAADVEMAVTRRIEDPARYVFELKTIDDRPGRMIVRRAVDERVYDAEATVGRFKSPDDVALAERQLAAFDRHMRLFGQKRALPVSDGESR